jgi:carbamoyl-phosphate synthase large subunit
MRFAMTSDRPRLLFTGGGGAGSEALYRLLGDRYDVHFADADPEVKPASVPAGSWHRIPFAADADFVAGLRRLCGDLGVDLLVPGVDEELLPIAQSAAAVAPEVLLPPAAFIETHLDKLTSQAVLRSKGIAVPETGTLSDRRGITFPCIVKPRRGRGSRDVAIVRSEEELRAHVVMCRRPADDFIVQERLEGQEFTVTMVADRAGVLRAVVPVKVRVKKGITLRAETDRDGAVIAACAAIHAASRVTGCFNIQLVKNAAGEVKPFELNPRVSTTVCLALAAGVNFVDLYLGGGAATAASELAPFQDRLRLKRSWHNEFLSPETA